MTEEGKARPAMGAREWGLLISLSLLWGGSFFFVEVALADFPPFTLVLGRMGLAAACLWLFLAASGHGDHRIARVDDG